MRLRRPLLRTSFATAFALLGAVAFGSCTSSTEPPRATAIQFAVGLVNLDAIGATQQVAATVLDQRGTTMSTAGLSWSSSVPSVATVSPSGLVTGLTNGTTLITAMVGGISATVSATVLQTPVAPVVIAGNDQSGLVLAPLASVIQVRVEDRLGNVMAGRPVTFAVTAGGGTVGTPTVNADAAGLASTSWTLGSSTAGLHRVSATVPGSTGATEISATALAGPPSSVGIAPGNLGSGQFAKFGTAVAVRPAVKVADALGNGVAGASVSFTVLLGGGSVTGGTVLTDVNGTATVGSWTLGPATGPNSLRAIYAALPPVDFTATATEDPCTPAGAPPIAVGETKTGTISSTDCKVAAPDNRNFDLFRLDLATTTSVVIDMTGSTSTSVFDAFLYLISFSNPADTIAFNDDIDPGVIRNARIGAALPAGSYLIKATTLEPNQPGPYGLSVRAATLGVPVLIAANSPNGQIAAPGAVVGSAPSVIVKDEAGTPVANVQVTFATLPGVGSISNATAMTNASGIATAGSWTIAAGTNVLSATIAGIVTGNPVVFSASGKASSAGFDISLRFVAMPTPTQLQTFSNAAARWESIITGDIAAQPLNLGAGSCNSPGAINETLDDVAIIVRLEPIDGVGQILGSAGPCFTRNVGSLPILGTMQFDTADLANLETAGTFGSVILHEMGHVLGIGTIWSTKGLLQNPSPTSGTGLDTFFSGLNAIAAFNTIGGTTYTGGGKVPVENSQGGAGTRNSHWRESVLLNELMTGFLNGGANPLSILTIQSLGDLGYTVTNVPADAFAITPTLRGEGSIEPAGVALGDDIWKGPVYRVDSKGRPIGAPGAETKAPRK